MCYILVQKEKKNFIFMSYMRKIFVFGMRSKCTCMSSLEEGYAIIKLTEPLN
jgi:hypothetical protein